jgi:deoxyribodipyrimidine photo-lyase
MAEDRPTIIWFRRDLRLADNPALAAALERGGPIVPIFIWSPEEDGAWAPGNASRWWLHQSLAKLAESLARRDSKLIVRRGPTPQALWALVHATRADTVFWNRLYDPEATAQDRKIKENLRENGLCVKTFNANLLFEPSEIRNQQYRPFQVFSAYWRAVTKLAEPRCPSAAPRRMPTPASWPTSLSLEELGLQPTVDWAVGMRGAWRPGERGAHQKLRGFLTKAFVDYPTGRDRPDRTGTSRLSPHLHFGELSPRQVWHAVRARQARSRARGAAAAAEAYLRELGWREFAHQLLYNFPDTTSEPLKARFSRFPWSRAPQNLRAWQRGRTGYPIVDAGMRELWTTGWMHNRVRMIAASFLVKHLLIDWREGAAWFWDTLVDGDLANNTLGWQWVAGCGADAAPYFRIFNPVLQGRKFDPNGIYVRRWVPELAKLPTKWVHAPWEAPASVLQSAEIELGTDYPTPIVDHAAARNSALAALAEIRD